jgi:hypothetical protein
MFDSYGDAAAPTKSTGALRILWRKAASRILLATSDRRARSHGLKMRSRPESPHGTCRPLLLTSSSIHSRAHAAAPRNDSRLNTPRVNGWPFFVDHHEPSLPTAAFKSDMDSVTVEHAAPSALLVTLQDAVHHASIPNWRDQVHVGSSGCDSRKLLRRFAGRSSATLGGYAPQMARAGELRPAWFTL